MVVPECLSLRQSVCPSKGLCSFLSAAWVCLGEACTLFTSGQLVLIPCGNGHGHSNFHSTLSPEDANAAKLNTLLMRLPEVEDSGLAIQMHKIWRAAGLAEVREGAHSLVGVKRQRPGHRFCSCGSRTGKAREPVALVAAP